MDNRGGKKKTTGRVVSFVNEGSQRKCLTIVLAIMTLVLVSLACQTLSTELEATPMVVQDTATPQVVMADTATAMPVDSTEASGGAEEVEILSWQMGPEIDLDTFDVIDPTEVFFPQDTVYVLLWTENEAGIELPYKGTWRNPDGVRILIEESTVSTGESGWYLSGDPPPGGWEVGEYNIELAVAGEVIETWDFTVDGDCPDCSSSESEEDGGTNGAPSGTASYTDAFDLDGGHWEDCEQCSWQDGQLLLGPWPISGAYYQHNVLCSECGTPRYYRMAVDVIYEEGPSERGFGLLLKWNDEVMITAEVTPWQTLAVWQFNYAEDEWAMLQGDLYGAVKPGRQVNRLEVEVSPSGGSGKATYAVGVNGKKQIILEGQSSGSGLLGLTIFGHATAARFDNFEFEPLDPATVGPDEENGGVSG